MRKLWIVLLLMTLWSCEKDKIEAINCEKFFEASINLDESSVKTEIEKLTVDLSPTPTVEDDIGHIANINTLIDRLNSNCDSYSASLLCYACKYSFPAQSEILIEFNDGPTVVIRIHTPKNDILRFAGIIYYEYPN